MPTKLKRKKTVEKGPKETVVLMCPDCGGDNLYYEAGMITGQKYTCKRCGYVGTFALERRVIVGKDGRVREL